MRSDIKMDGYFALRLEGWIKEEIMKMDKKERASLVESIRILLEHAARNHKAGITVNQSSSGAER